MRLNYKTGHILISILFGILLIPVNTPQAQANQWVEIAPINTPRSRPSLAYVGSSNKFYLIGGESSGGDRNLSIEEYDPSLGIWVNKTLLLTGVANTGAVSVNNLIYIVGGYTGSVGIANLQIYNPATNTVTLGADMPDINYGHTVTALGNYIHVLGGSTTADEGTTHYIYDTINNTWTTGAPTPYANNYAAATTDGIHIYLMGGNTSNSNYVDQYDPVTDSWTSFVSLTTGRGGLGAYYDGEQIHAVAGGWGSYLTTTESFGKNGWSWAANNPVNVGTRTFGLVYGNGYAMKAGGWSGAYINSVEINDQIFANEFE